MLLTNPHTIRGIPKRKYVERFWGFDPRLLSFESVDNFETSEYVRRIVDRGKRRMRKYYSGKSWLFTIYTIYQNFPENPVGK